MPVDKIGEVIGPKGKMINSITEETGAQISIEDDGTVFVGASNGEAAQAAIDKINAIANPQLPKIGERFLGTVVKTTDFGAFVSLLPGRDGLVHISKLGRGKRIAQGRGRGERRRQASRRDRRHRQAGQDLPGAGRGRGRAATPARTASADARPEPRKTGADADAATASS